MRKTVLISVACISLFCSVLRGAEVIKHKFLAMDEGRHQIHYVDQHNPKNDWTLAVLRGGDWLTYDRSELLFNLRDKVRADWRDDTTGFRCVRVR